MTSDASSALNEWWGSHFASLTASEKMTPAVDQFDADPVAPNLYVCCPGKYAGVVDKQPSTSGGGVWGLALPESNSASKGVLNLRIKDPKSGQLRWAEQVVRGFPLSTKHGATFGEWSSPSFSELDFSSGYCPNIPEDPLPYGQQYSYGESSSQLYAVKSGDSLSTPEIPADVLARLGVANVSGTICPGEYATEGAKDPDSAYAKEGKFYRFGPPPFYAMLEQGQTFGPHTVQVGREDSLFLTYGYKSWVFSQENWSDGIYLIPTDMVPGIYVSEGAIDPDVPGTWERLADYGGAQVIAHGGSGDPADNTVIIDAADYAFHTRGYKAWTLKMATPADDIYAKPSAWLQVAELEYRNFNANPWAQTCVSYGVILAG